jgi:hypothetical protein
MFGEVVTFSGGKLALATSAAQPARSNDFPQILGSLRQVPERRNERLLGQAMNPTAQPLVGKTFRK